MYDILKTNNDLPEQFAMFVFMLSAKGDPHFKFGIENIEFPFCFDIKTDPGSIVRILQIPKGNMYPKGLIFVVCFNFDLKTPLLEIAEKNKVNT